METWYKYKVKQTASLHDPTMMLLMGMWMSFTKKPMKPMMAKPMAVATAIFWNSGKIKWRLIVEKPIMTGYELIVKTFCLP